MLLPLMRKENIRLPRTMAGPSACLGSFHSWSVRQIGPFGKIGFPKRFWLLAVVFSLTQVWEPHFANAAGSAEMIQHLLPSVVRITVHQLVDDAKAQDAESFGTGIIVDPAGYIVTNRHVVERAYEVIVTLNDGAIHHAKLIGDGGDVDLALLKIDSHHKLAAVVLANDANVRIADEVFAIGNPYGIGTTVTRGIVSAINRDLNRSPFDSYLQTDAAINRGNSGGPLVNSKGEVIGISTAYYRGPLEKGGSIGLGFAIPSTVAKTIIDLIRQHGYPRVGWFGVDGQTLNSEMASALDLPHASGAIIVSVRHDGPSVDALRPDDIVLEIDGQKLLDMRMFQRAAVGSIGKPVRLKILRERKEQQIIVTPAERPVARVTPAKTSSSDGLGNANPFGLTLAPLDEARRSELSLSKAAPGVNVENVASISASAEAGISKGDVIESVQLRPVYAKGEVVSALAELTKQRRDFALLRIRSGDRVRFVTLHLIWQGPMNVQSK